MRALATLLPLDAACGQWAGGANEAAPWLHFSIPGEGAEQGQGSGPTRPWAEWPAGVQVCGTQGGPGECAVGSQGSGSRAAALHWQPLQAPEQLSPWLAGPTPQPSKHLPSGRPGAGLWRAGRGPARRGIEAPDLHPEATFPGSFRPHSSSLPWFWSGIRPFQPSPRGCTAQPQAGLLLFRGAKTRQNPGCTEAR